MGPFIKDKENVNKINLKLFLALIPLFIFGVYKNFYIPFVNEYTTFTLILSPFIKLILALIIFLLSNLIYNKIKKSNENDNFYAIIQAIIFTLIMPVNLKLLMFVIILIISNIIKIIFKYYNKFIFNPILIGYMIMILLSINNYNKIFLNNYEQEKIDKTPIINMYDIKGIGNYDSLVKPYGNLMDLFIGNVPDSFMITSSLLCLIMFIILVFTNTIKWKISISYLITIFFITFVIGQLFDQGLYYSIFHILIGGLIFSSLFLITDNLTSAVTPLGQILQGVLTGIITVLFRFLGIEATVFSILIISPLVPYLDMIGATSRFNILKIIKCLILICMIIIFEITLIAFLNRNFR